MPYFLDKYKEHIDNAYDDMKASYLDFTINPNKRTKRKLLENIKAFRYYLYTFTSKIKDSVVKGE